jgi:hypothetical protein
MILSSHSFTLPLCSRVSFSFAFTALCVAWRCTQYVLYLLGSIGFRLYWIIDSGGVSRSMVLLLALGILVELYISYITFRFARILYHLTAADRAQLSPPEPAQAPIFPAFA